MYAYGLKTLKYYICTHMLARPGLQLMYTYDRSSHMSAHAEHSANFFYKKRPLFHLPIQLWVYRIDIHTYTKPV